MYKIYIDTTERFEKRITLKEVEKGAGMTTKKEMEIDFLQGDIDIVATIQQILEKNNLKLADIKEFVPNPGPGSFTGIKIGITVANVLNWVLGKKSQENLAKPVYGKAPNITQGKV